MKKILAICFGILVITSLNNTAFAKISTIKFCTLPFAPFVITEPNNPQLTGFDIDLANALCKEIGAECKFIRQQQRATLLTDLNSGKCDAWVSGFTITDIRKKDMDFTKPYYPSTAGFVVPKKSTFTSSPKDMQDKKIGVTDSSNFASYLEITYGYDIKMTKFANDSNALIALKSNKIDAVISDAPALKYWMQQKGNEGFRLIDLPATNKEFSLGHGYGIPVKKGNTELLSTLNQALTKIKAIATYDELVKKYSMDK